VNIPHIVDALMPPVEEEWTCSTGMRLVTSDGYVRAMIAADGEVCDGNAKTVAYIEGNGEVGDPEMQYVGKASAGSGQVTDEKDVCIGTYDSGHGVIKDARGSVLAEVRKEGTVRRDYISEITASLVSRRGPLKMAAGTLTSQVLNNAGRTVGKVEGFSYVAMSTVAAYVLLVDRAFVR
jgi:hypothetical protein